MVQPKINALDEATRNVAIVVFNENDASFQAGFTAEFVNFLDQRLAGFVSRMRFASENELHRTCGIVRQAFQSFLVTEQQRPPLISGEPAGETDGQNFRIKNTVYSAD